MQLCYLAELHVLEHNALTAYCSVCLLLFRRWITRNIISAKQPSVSTSNMLVCMTCHVLSLGGFYIWLRRCLYASRRPSRKSGCAMAIRFSARSLRVLPLSGAMPYSVTI